MHNSRPWLRALWCATVIACASPAFAQSEKKFGVVIGYPADVGVQWQLTDRVAIRADTAFNFGTVEQTVVTSVSVGSLSNLSLASIGSALGTVTSRFHHSSAEVGLTGLFTVSRHDQLRLYLAPRVAWTTMRTEASISGASIDLPFGLSAMTIPADKTSTSSNGVALSGSFGGSYRLSDRFDVFGESGISYVTPTATGSSDGGETSSYQVGLRSNLGIVLRF